MITIPYIKYVSIIVPIVVILVALLANRLGPINSTFETISKHVSRHNKLFYLLAITITILSIPYYVYIAVWLIPFYNISTFMYLIMIVSYFGLLLTVWVPAIPGRRYVIHTTGAVLVAVGMLSLGVGLSMTEALGYAGRLASFVFVIFSLFLAINALFNLKKINMLYSEALFIVVFYLMTIIVTFC